MADKNPIKDWITAARLRTLPLAVAGILLGSFLAAYEYRFSLPVCVLALLTAVLLQILSNLANDYGDFVKGTDQAAGRSDRALASGRISQRSMLRGLYVTTTLTLISGIALLIISSEQVGWKVWLWFLIGLGAIMAAVKYTVGNSAYGYKGLGDLFVLLFFGPVSVGGTYFLMSGTFYGNILVPGFALGLLCVAVLNINNLRDITDDERSGKRTLVVRMGFERGILYQYLLLGTSMVLFILFARLTATPADHYLLIPFAVFYYFNTRGLSKHQGDRLQFNKALKQVSLTSLLLVIVLGLSWILL